MKIIKTNFYIFLEVLAQNYNYWDKRKYNINCIILLNVDNYIFQDAPDRHSTINTGKRKYNINCIILLNVDKVYFQDAPDRHSTIYTGKIH
jgi:hypothetical protein